MHETVGDGEDLRERYCSYCGRSTVPLRSWHVERACDTCGRNVYLAEPGAGGRGIKVERGDRFIIPAGTIKLSLDPRVGGKFSRPGLLWFVQYLLTAVRPSEAAALEGLLDCYEEEGENLLRSSPLLEGLDVDREKDGEEIWERLAEHREKQEYFAAVMAASAHRVREALVEAHRAGEAGEHVREAAWHMYNAALAHALYRVKDRHFEEILWQGYLAYTFQARVADAAAQTPAEVQALNKLTPFFERLGESVLHTWLGDGRPIGPRIGVADIPEPTLRAQCTYYLDLFERRRQEAQRLEENRRKDRDLLVKYLSWSVVSVSTVVSGLWALLKYLGVL